MAEAPKQPEPLGVGIHDIPAEQYHADPCDTPSLSRSISHTLLEQSPMHAWHQHPLLNPNYQSTHKPIFDKAHAAHSVLLGGDGKLCVINEKAWRKVVAKDARDEAR